MKAFSLLLSAILVAMSSFGQTNLSKSGAAHLRAAEVLSATAQTSDDRVQIAKEYEHVIETDPSYANAYLEAAKIYTILTPELGESTYNKAKNLLNQYLNLEPSQSDTVDTELIVLDAMLQKYKNKPEKVDGLWGYYVNGRFNSVLEVYNSGYSYNVKLVDPSCFLGVHHTLRDAKVTVNGCNCNIIIEKYWDDRPNLREKGLKSYYGERSNNADPGYPAHGRYYYNGHLQISYYTVDLTNTPLVLNCDKIQWIYYLDGLRTYSSTGTDFDNAFDMSLKRK